MVGWFLYTAVASAAPPLADLDALSRDLDGLELLQIDVDAELLRERAYTHTPSAIWAGSEVRGEHANVVALVMVDPWYGQVSVFCSGSLIQPDWVLTASHCIDMVEDYEAYGFEYYVLTGDNIVAGNYDDVAPFRRVFEHPDHDGNGQIVNDIGLIRLESNLDGVPLTVLNDKEPKDGWIGSEHNYVGFGVTYDDGGDGGVKRETWIPVNDFDSMYIYAYSPDTNVCSGDSGGPSFRDTKDGPIQVGVNVYVTPGCVGGANGSTRVDAYIDWILEHVDTLVLASDDATTGATGGTETGGTESGGIDRPSGEPEGFGADWDAAVTPEKGTYPAGLRCASGGGPVGGIAWLALGLLVARRRR